MAVTTNFGWEYPDVDSDADTWGDILNAMFNQMDTDVKAIKNTADAAAVAATVNALIAAAAPPGKVSYFARGSAPPGWVKANGGTIGNAASGGTLRADADTQNLFFALWNDFDNTVLPIQDSAGAPSTRGVSSAADYAANKRLPVLDLRAEFLRGVDDGRGVDTLFTLGKAFLDQVQGFFMSLPGLRQVGSGASFAGSGAGDNPGAINQTGGPIDDGTHGTPRIGMETRPRFVGLLACMKL